ncbi:uncharacterized protein LOC126737653 [Anthonomus grandis grandis]|uniref:uncharacterized protein LOC126737653 n=1 Tax=Anthonomus grandis grandis TaxID=2921223 RepID=UPI002165BBBD|nr:uncharacterized protein LOC126737653 [Anthonomus grandis grandis]
MRQIAVFGTSAYPNLRRKTTLADVGYAVLNETVAPAPDGCTVNSISDLYLVISACTTINVGSFEVPAAKQPLIMYLKTGTRITFTGQIVFAKRAVKGYLIEIFGKNVHVLGSSTHQFHGHGELYWDGKGGAGSPKPVFMYLRGINSVFIGLHLLNCPMRCVAIDNSNNIIVSRFLIDNRAGAHGTAARGKEGHNTDGFDVAKTQYLILRDHVIYNQDDCVAINDGAHMVIDNLYCDGSHGFDIATGMSTTDVNRNVVYNITFQNSLLYDGMYGLHILTCNDGGTGYVKNVYYKNITFSGPSDYGIMIQQDFANLAQGSTGHATGNVPISNVRYEGITGEMNGKYSYALSIRCATDGCSDIEFNEVSITNAKSSNECKNYIISGWC